MTGKPLQVAVYSVTGTTEAPQPEDKAYRLWAVKQQGK